MEEVKQEIIKDPSTPEITVESLIKIEEISNGSPNPEQIAPDSLPGTDIGSDTHVLHIDHELNGESGMEEVKQEIIKDRHSFKFYHCYGNKNGRQNMLKTEKLQF